MHRTGAVILAAGGSSRLGCPKQFLTHHGRTLLRRAVDAASGCSPVVVVAGGDFARVEAELQGVGASVIEHREWKRGIGSSIRVGVSRALELASDLEALILLVCDQPFVTKEVLAALRARHDAERKPAIASSYAGTLGTPALFDRSLFPELLALPDERGAKQIIARLGDRAARLAFPEGAIDIDSPADSLAHLRPSRETAPLGDASA